jgi:hypothetical protein
MDHLAVVASNAYTEVIHAPALPDLGAAVVVPELIATARLRRLGY